MRVADLAVLAVEQVGGDDLEVVVGGMGEGAAAVAVAERPDAGHVGGQGVVDGDVAARVGAHAGLVEAEVVGVRPAADRQQDVRADRLGRRPRCSRPPTATPSVVRRQADALGAGPDARCLRASRISRIAAETSSSSRAIRRGAISTIVTVGAEAPVHLRELEADVAAADDDEMPRHAVERQDRRVGQKRHVVHAGQVGHDARGRRR